MSKPTMRYFEREDVIYIAITDEHERGSVAAWSCVRTLRRS